MLGGANSIELSKLKLFIEKSAKKIKILSVEIISTLLFVCFKGSRQWYAGRLTDVSVFAEIPFGHGTPP